MDKYIITGMSCAACASRVEKAVMAVDGVNSCAVNLLSNSMGVEGSASYDDVINAVVKAGYGAELRSGIGVGKTGGNGDKLKTNGSTDRNIAGLGALSDDLEDRETPLLKKRLLYSVMFLLPLMYVSMGHTMFGWPLISVLNNNPVGIGIFEMLLAGIVMLINQKFFVNGFRGLINKSPNMDTLVALGSMASFVYSVCVLFSMSKMLCIVAQGQENSVLNALMSAGTNAFFGDFYFESSAMILTLITVGKMLEAKSKGKTTDAIKSLMKLTPQTAVVIKDGEEVTLSIQEVEKGDLFVVRPGESIPVDGVICQGISAVDESAFTGESVPVDKAENDKVYAATINTYGNLLCEATSVGEDTTFSKIIELVSDAAATKAPIAKIADRVSGVFVPAIISIAVITFIAWMIVGESVGFSLSRAISVLVISCPCALGLATPVAIMVGNGVGAKNGILFKTAAALEMTGRVDIVALDKTGTITTGKMSVSDIIPAKGVTKEELVQVAVALEEKSEHPISSAIVALKLCKPETNTIPVTDFISIPGKGLKGELSGTYIYGGNEEFILSDTKADTSELKVDALKLAKEGKTPVFFAKEGKFLGIIAVSDSIREDSERAIKELKDLGISIVMLTGDNALTANEIAKEAGVDMVFSSVKPDQKEEIVSKLMQKGRVAMVGDGINDAPSLSRADVGIAIGAGTDIAIDSSDVVLMKDSLSSVAAAIRISKAAVINIKENLFWAFFYNVIGIPLAAGCYIKAFGWTLNPMFGAAAMSLSSFCVVSNALRLNFIDIKSKKYNWKGLSPSYKRSKYEEAYLNKKTKVVIDDICIEKTNNMEDKNMVISVKGMMCAHCEAHVKDALLKIAGVDEVVANHDKDLVTLTTSKDISLEEVKTAVENAGYEYCGML